jgi:hypothetical protein
VKKTKIRTAATAVLQVLQLSGGVFLLAVLITGVSAVLGRLIPAREWVFYDTEGERMDGLGLVSFIIGLILWFWLILKIKRAGMTDEQKRDADQVYIDDEW